MEGNNVINRKEDYTEYTVPKPPPSTSIGIAIVIIIFCVAFLNSDGDALGWLWLILVFLTMILFILSVLTTRRVRIGNSYFEYINLFSKEKIQLDKVKAMGVFRTGAYRNLKFLSQEELEKTDRSVYGVYIFLAKERFFSESDVYRKSMVIPYGESYYKQIKLVG